MKFTVDLECTPEEARQFLGLPDVVPMQDALMKDIERRMTEGLNAMEPDSLLKLWLPATLQGWGDMQKTMWSQMQAMATGAYTGGNAKKSEK